MSRYYRRIVLDIIQGFIRPVMSKQAIARMARGRNISDQKFENIINELEDEGIIHTDSDARGNWFIYREVR